MQHNKQHQEHGVHCDLWVQRLAIQEQAHGHRLPPVEEICRFCQAVKWNDETSTCYRSAQIVLAHLYDPPQESKRLFEDLTAFSQGQILQQHICVYVRGCIACGKCPN